MFSDAKIQERIDSDTVQISPLILYTGSEMEGSVACEAVFIT